jgi:RNA polymerase sigma factor (sigma-70 family)
MVPPPFSPQYVKLWFHAQRERAMGLPFSRFSCNTRRFRLCIHVGSTMTLTPSTRASLLLRLCDSEDHQAWVEFVTLYEPVIYRLLRQHGLQDADAHDVMQELLLAVSRSIDRWDPAKECGSFRGWLGRVARNLVINWLKQRRGHAAAIGGSDLQAMLVMLPVATEPDTVEFDRELRRTLIHRAGQRVRCEVQPATWEAFWETAVVGTSPAVAATKLGMTVGAVRVAKCRVLARLREAVSKLEKPT